MCSDCPRAHDMQRRTSACSIHIAGTCCMTVPRYRTSADSPGAFWSHFHPWRCCVVQLSPSMQERKKLTDLDDDCLLTIFQFLAPLPDVISVSKACRRFHSLTGDGRMRLLVLAPVDGCCAMSTEAAQRAARTRNCRAAFHSLAEAVQGSRPGDKVVLDPGVHEVADVAIHWPLHLAGGGTAAEDTVLRCVKSNDGALDFRASGKLANLSVHSTANACITHRQGNLTVEACNLHCAGNGLNFLFAPIVTLATERGCRRIGAAGVSAGVLNVVETRIRGGQGSLAVRTEGSGALDAVRVINLLRGTVFWFRVDSAVPGLPAAVLAWQQRGALQQGTVKQEAQEGTALGPSASPAAAAKLPQPSWAGSPASPSTAVLEQRAKAWHLAHHARVTAIAAAAADDESCAPQQKRQRC